MIDRIRGRVLARTENSLVVLVGGVGLRINVPKLTLESLAEDVDLYTLLIVREDALALYGFADEGERFVFETLMKVNGVGPRLALAILSTLTVERLRDAVGREQVDVLTRVPGVGKRTAQKIVLDLKDKLGFKLGLEAIPAFDDLNGDVAATLVALGYSIVEAQSAIQSLPANAPTDLEERVRLALQYFT